MPDESTPDDALSASRALAARLGAAVWEVEGEPLDDPLEVEVAPPAPPPLPPPPIPRATPAAPEPRPQVSDPERIVEAMLFVGGAPLTPEAVAAVIRGFTPERFREAVEAMNRQYREQNRPYAVERRDSGYVLAVKPAYKSVRERLYGGPREARLTQPALDVLSLVAYRQPITKPDVDALRGADSASVLRQLVRLGLIAVTQRDAEAVGYGTTPRFLELFHLSGLDDLPRLGEPG